MVVKIKLIKTLLFGIFLCSFATIHAQEFTKSKRYISVGGCLNAINYVGDLDPSASLIAPALRYTRPNLGVVFMYRYAPRISFRGSFAFGWVEGNDRKVQNPTPGTEPYWRYIRGANFSSNIFELKADMVIDLFENRGKWMKRPDFTPYGFFGLAYYNMSPTASYSFGSKSLIDANPEGNGIISHQISVPFGVGLRYKIGKQWDLAFEIGVRKTFTGNMDGVKGTYADPRKLSADERRFANPSMDGYGSNSDVTKAINNQGINVFDLSSGQLVATFKNDNNNQLQSNQSTSLSSFQNDPNMYVTPVGFGWDGPNSPAPKRGQNLTDWYFVTGFHLTYIITTGVICPKFR